MICLSPPLLIREIEYGKVRLALFVKVGEAFMCARQIKAAYTLHIVGSVFVFRQVLNSEVKIIEGNELCFRSRSAEHLAKALCKGGFSGG